MSGRPGPRYHLALDLAGRRAVVVGGGPVAARRAHGLLDAGADVLVVAPALCEDLAALVRAGALHWLGREVRPDDLDGAWLVHTATGDPEVDGQVAAEAEQRRIWCVRADDARSSTAWRPAVTSVQLSSDSTSEEASEEASQSGPDVVTVAVTSNGDPRRSVRLRDAVAAALATGSLPLRRRRQGGPGHVALVGGGPGDPGLVTARGRQLLAAADVVVVDRLAPLALLDSLDEDVLVVDVGKTPDHHPVPQDEINRLLVQHAQAGRRVVRLKGGDPFVLGRGGEEALACLAAGVDVEVVPGVTSAVAVPAAAGIPVTHRGLARGFAVVSAHEALEDPELARMDGTLVLLMGVTRLAESCAALVAHGKDPGTPVAVVERGFSADQRTTLGTLASIADLAAVRDVRNPAVVVVGEVARLHEQLDGLAGVARRHPHGRQEARS
ncbi:MAG TPA: uroporphyrinogen-III C-methyltransferase [Motilibacteraceae bacterium]|nr:uroporphyrinogen-III C-methyltransferase [Motilibacteraceae bacterium]